MAGARPETLTVMFTDVVGSTAWRAQVGDDTADVRTAELERASRAVVVAAGGTVVKSVGDGVMATFPSAVVALDAAAGIQAVARRLAVAGIRDCLRVGVSTGDLVREGDDWMGTAAIEASRLCAEATGGTVLVAGTTARLARNRTGGRLRSLGDRVLRGFVEPIDVYELIDASGAFVTLPPVLDRAVGTPLIGRSAMLRRARQMLAEVADGRAATTLIVGEPGVGKTRLAAEFARIAMEQGCAVLHGHCDEGIAAPYQPVIEAFGPWLDNCPEPARAQVLGTSASHLVALWPELVARGMSSISESADGERQRWRLFAAVSDLCRAIADDRPVLIVIDDLQWAEPSTILLLGHLIRQDIGRAALLATVRPGTGGHPVNVFGDLGTGRSIDVIGLTGLSEDELSVLVSQHTSRSAPTELVRRLHTETAGNPFFLRALLAHLEEVAHVIAADGTWITAGELDAVGVPHGARATIERRLAVLAPPARRAIEVAAVAGASFAERTVRSVLGVTPDEAVDALDEAVKAGLLQEESAGRLSFVHAIVRHAVVETLSRTRLAQLHWRVAEALERDADTRTAALGTIADHYSSGRAIGDPATVVRSALAAGDDAMRRLAFAEASSHFRTALDLVDDDPMVRYGILTSLGSALNALAETDVSDVLWLEAAALARAAGDAVRLHAAIAGYVSMIRVQPPDEVIALIDSLNAMLDPADSPLRAVAMGWKAQGWMGGNLSSLTRGDARLADAAVDMARRINDPWALATVLRGRLAMRELDAPDALAQLRDAFELTALEQEHGAALRLETGTASRDLARALIRCGRASEAGPHVQRARVDAERTGDRGALTSALYIEGALAAGCGQFTDARRLAQEATLAGGRHDRLGPYRYGAQLLAVEMEQGAVQHVIETLEQLGSLDVAAPEWNSLLATALATVGRSSEATEILRAIDLAELFDVTRLGKPLAVRHLAETCRLVGDRTFALELLPRVAPWTGQILLVALGSSIEGASDRSMGHLLSVLGRHDEAVAAYSAAAELERTAGLAPCLARTEYWLGRLLLERSRPGDERRARDLLDGVQAISEKLGMRLLHEQARGLRASLST